MKGRSILVIAGLVIAGTVLAGAATARPIDKGHFHDVFTSDVFDCNGTPAQNSVDVSGNFCSTSAAHHRSRTTGKACAAPS